jgi:hypothetical protein
MKDYSFYDLVQGNSIARSAKQILEGSNSLESKLKDGAKWKVLFRWRTTSYNS